MLTADQASPNLDTRHLTPGGLLHNMGTLLKVIHLASGSGLSVAVRLEGQLGSRIT